MHIHEKWIDGKRYLDEIRSCSCAGKTGDEYELYCKIHQRGKDYYQYRKNCGFISNSYSEKKLYLTKEAEKTAKEAADEFDRAVSTLEKSDHITVEILKDKFTVIMKKRSKNSFDTVFYFKSRDNCLTVRMLKDVSIDEIIGKSSSVLILELEKNESSYLLDLRGVTAESLKTNPFYLMAIKTGDELLRLKIRLYYNLATVDDCRKLGRIFGKPVLPALGEEYDRNYIIPAEEVDMYLLSRSGYRCLHRPYFAMKGSSHDLFTINPHTKYIVDAGKEDEEITSFNDFLKLFGSAGRKYYK